MTTLMEKVKELIKKKQEKKEAQKQLDDINRKCDELEEIVFSLMISEDITSLKVLDETGEIKTVYTMIREYPRIREESKDSFYSWLKLHGFDYLFSVNSNSLKSWYREYQETHDISELSNMIEVYEDKAIGIRKG